MNIDELSIEEIVEYINNQLLLGRSMKEIETLDFMVNDRVIVKRLNRKGYKRVGNKFIKNNDLKSVDERVKTVEVMAKKPDDNLMTGVIDKEKQYKLLNLIKYHDELINLVTNFGDVQMTDIKPKEIVIRLPKEEDKKFRTTIRVNDVVWKRFKMFCDNNNDFNQKDLLSMALHEYMNKIED